MYIIHEVYDTHTKETLNHKQKVEIDDHSTAASSEFRVRCETPRFGSQKRKNHTCICWKQLE